MIIKRLTLKNFQKHKKKELIFTPGLNVIKGESAQGKSAMIRALRLLFENQPRGADKLFTRTGSKKPLEVEIEDSRGNIVKRTKKKYILNGIELKAFKHEVPLPIRELFFTKSINWHKQFDPHFLVMSNPGQAAKSLNAATGLEEQEEIIKQLKEKQSKCKEEIKRHTKNAEEANARIKQLRPVVKLLLNARSIKGIKDKSELKEEKIEILSDLVNSLKKLDKRLGKYNIEPFLSQISEVVVLIDELEKIEEDKQKIVDLLNGIDDSNIIHEKIINSLIKEVYDLIQLIPSLNENKSNCSTLQNYLSSIQSIEKDLVVRKKEIKEKEEGFKNTLSKFGVCPLCNQEI